MHSKLRLVGITTIIVMVATFLMAYFVKPHSILPEVADLPEDYASLPEHSSDVPLATRISKASGFAFVLTVSEFSRENANVFVALRDWGIEMLQRDPTFLCAPQYRHQFEVPSSLFGSFVYNVFAAPRILAEETLLHIVRRQLHVFHKTEVYTQIRQDYYDSFGRDRESALLLSNYELDRAKKSVPTILSALYWLAVVGIGVYRFFYVHQGMIDKIQKSMSGLWLALALFYLIETWSQNSVQVMLSSILCAGVGFYLRKPITGKRQADGGLSLKMVSLTTRQLLLLAFVTISLLIIHILTWIKTGSLENPDPVTLLFFSLGGNYFHDPMLAKRVLERTLGMLWVLSLAWLLKMLTTEQEIDLEAPERLDSLITREI
jgi:hypothetical protein